MSTGVQRESDEPAYENRHSCFVHRGLSQAKSPLVRHQNAKWFRISWDGRVSVRALPNALSKTCPGLKVGFCVEVRMGISILASSPLSRRAPGSHERPYLPSRGSAAR